MFAHIVRSIPPSVSPMTGGSKQRIRQLLLAMASVGLLLSVGQVAGQETASAQAPAPAKPTRNGKVCQSEEVTGSRMKKRVCYTPAEWEARQRAAKELVREMDGKPVGERADGG